MIDNRRMKREDSLDAHAEADLANRYALACTAMLTCYYDAFENLKAFFVAFLDPDVNFNRIARLERRDIFS